MTVSRRRFLGFTIAAPALAAAASGVPTTVEALEALGVYDAAPKAEAKGLQVHVHDRPDRAFLTQVTVECDAGGDGRWMWSDLLDTYDAVDWDTGGRQLIADNAIAAFKRQGIAVNRDALLGLLSR